MWIAGETDPDWIPELINAVREAHEGFAWIKMSENRFYDQVKTSEFGEIRSLNPALYPWSGNFQSIFGTVNGFLDKEQMH